MRTIGMSGYPTTMQGVLQLKQMELWVLYKTMMMSLKMKRSMIHPQHKDQAPHLLPHRQQPQQYQIRLAVIAIQVM